MKVAISAILSGGIMCYAGYYAGYYWGSRKAKGEASQTDTKARPVTQQSEVPKPVKPESVAQPTDKNYL